MPARIDDPVRQAKALEMKQQGLTFEEVGMLLGVSKPVVVRWLRDHPEFRRERDPAARFWKEVDKQGPAHPIHGRCWVWIAYKMENGYGTFSVGGDDKMLAHRYSYQLHHGEIPKGLQILHKCDNRCCVRPEHLFAGTAQDNMNDMVTKERHTFGEKTYNALATNKVVREIRRRYQRYSRRNGTGALAKEFNLSHVEVWRIAMGCRWRHVEET